MCMYACPGVWGGMRPNCEKLTHRLWTNSALFTNFNVTCAMQVMLVSQAVIYTVLKNTTFLHQLASIFTTNILWLQRILQRTLVKCTNKFDCLVYEMSFIHELRPTLNVQSDSIHVQVFNLFLISFSLVFFFVCLCCLFTPANFIQNFYTSYLHTYFTFIFYTCFCTCLACSRELQMKWNSVPKPRGWHVPSRKMRRISYLFSLFVPITEFDPADQYVGSGMSVRPEMLCDEKTRRLLVNASEMFTKTFPQSTPSLAVNRELKHWRRRRQGRRLAKSEFKFYSRIS